VWALDDDDVPAPMPPTRVFDAGLPRRVASGLAGVWEARQIEGLLAWLQRYERVLAWVAVHGSGSAAQLACRVLAGDWDDAWLQEWIDGREGKTAAAAGASPQGCHAAGHG